MKRVLNQFPFPSLTRTAVNPFSLCLLGVVFSASGCTLHQTEAVIVDPGSGMQKLAQLRVEESPKSLEHYSLEWEIVDHEPLAPLPAADMGSTLTATKGQRGRDGALMISESQEAGGAVLKAPIPYSELLGPEDHLTVRWRLQSSQGVSNVLSTYQLGYDIALERVEMRGGITPQKGPVRVSSGGSYSFVVVVYNNSAKEVTSPFPVSIVVESESGATRFSHTTNLVNLKPFERRRVSFPLVPLLENGGYSVSVDANSPPQERLPEVELGNNSVRFSVQTESRPANPATLAHTVSFTQKQRSS